MAGRIEHVEAEAFDADAVAFGDAHGHDIRLGLLTHHGDAMRLVAQRAEPGYVVGMQMRIHSLDQLQVQLAHELHVAIHLFQHGIDDQRLAAAPGGDEIGVGAGNTVEKLSENHLSTPVAGLVVPDLGCELHRTYQQIIILRRKKRKERQGRIEWPAPRLILLAARKAM